MQTSRVPDHANICTNLSTSVHPLPPSFLRSAFLPLLTSHGASLLQVRQEFLGRVQERKEKYGADWDPQDQEQERDRQRKEEPPNFTIEGTAEGINEAIADDVKYLLQHDGKGEIDAS